MYMKIIFVCWLVFINMAAFAMFGMDKWKAKNRKYRIPERTLLISAIMGGSVGAILGMKFFHHKTLHAKFKTGLPLILLVQLAAGLFIGYVRGWII